MCSFLSTDCKRSLKLWACPNFDIYKVTEIKMACMDLGPVNDFLLLFTIKCSVSLYMNKWSYIYKTIIFMYINFLLLYYFFNIQMVTFKWKSPVFSGKFKEFCLAIPSVLKPWWQSNMHWVNSNWIGCDTKPPERDGWVSIFPDYLFKHTFYCIISDFFTLR